MLSNGKSLNYAYRAADGSNYSVLTPTFGMAGSPYARSVPTANPLPPSYLPDPGLVFDMLLKREDNVPHPGEISIFEVPPIVSEFAVMLIDIMQAGSRVCFSHLQTL